MLELSCENFVPVQVNRVSRLAGELFNRNYLLISKIDEFLLKTPFGLLCEGFGVIGRKVVNGTSPHPSSRGSVP